ncbi:hypothetical protein RhiirC2_870083 [Rhizophagus irregularis]|uniref:RBR-type E3 ubiquitin transferase n=1 Tax=Rhizophagus irregularis TaxID=588596 RepID=A0A2N1MM08_9GLOM|nr:hypothetical protein RhiirC2_870083 [Rhizophagus irregularis]
MFTRECTICLETKLNYHRITSKCIHEVVVCLECINRYIDTNIDKFETIIQFDQNAKIKITCPVPMCNKLMERDDIKKIATKEIYERYDFLTFKLAIQKNPRFRWCQASCGSGQIHIGEDPIFMCKGCDKNSCYTHGILWHENQTCEKYDEINKPLEIASERYLSKSTRCPKCNLYIDKTDGCDHMTCKCSHQFCMSCSHESPGHKSNCKYNIERRNKLNNLLSSLRRLIS